MNSTLIKCVVIDDEPLAIQILVDYIRQHASLNCVNTFDDAVAAKNWLNNNEVDLLFLDINMPDINGLELLKSLEKPPALVFTTAHREHAVDGFDLNAVDYLLKPISPDRFAKAVAKLETLFQPNEDDNYIMVNVEYRNVKILLKEIVYLESLEDYVRIHLKSEKPILTLSTLKSMVEKLPTTIFQRIHRSFIISKNEIKGVTSRKVKLSNGTELPVSDTYIDFTKEWLANHSK
ncbi:MAG: LytTR family DNA-binding domain-containing protein [Chitinophagaceae bacterium]|jgi:two-component system, LytTR family, response regulator|nr:LytTR family DNA-binding domain-containing protein [Chitinophagaceae bacterium]